MMIPLPAILTLAALFSTPVRAIVSGTSVPAIAKFPYMVSLQSASHFCGGVLINAHHVITTAECVTEVRASATRVRVGSLQYASGPLFSVGSIKIHEKYNPRTKTNNIAIVYLSVQATSGSFASLPLSPIEDPVPDSFAQVVGWGTTSQGASSIPTSLKFVSLAVQARSTCQQNLGVPVDSTMFCIYSNGKGPCSGDAGGPIVDRSSGTVLGLITGKSLNDPDADSQRCAQAGYPDVGVRLSQYILWIAGNQILEIR